MWRGNLRKKKKKKNKKKLQRKKTTRVKAAQRDYLEERELKVALSVHWCSAFEIHNGMITCLDYLFILEGFGLKKKKLDIFEAIHDRN